MSNPESEQRMHDSLARMRRFIELKENIDRTLTDICGMVLSHAPERDILRKMARTGEAIPFKTWHSEWLFIVTNERPHDPDRPLWTNMFGMDRGELVRLSIATDQRILWILGVRGRFGTLERGAEIEPVSYNDVLKEVRDPQRRWVLTSYGSPFIRVRKVA